MSTQVEEKNQDQSQKDRNISISSQSQKKEQRHRQSLELEWRRSKILELNSQGYSESETAKILQVSLGTVYRDLSILRQQARKNLRMHIEKTLPKPGIKDMLVYCT